MASIRAPRICRDADRLCRESGGRVDQSRHGAQSPGFDGPPRGRGRLGTALPHGTLAAFGALAVGLASVGVFGVLSYFVGQRTREIGIRIALGANPRDLLAMIVGRGLALAAIGLALGLAAAVPLTASMQSFLFEVSPLDAPTLVGVCVVLGFVAVLASYMPARRALRIQPIAALSSEWESSAGPRSDRPPRDRPIDRRFCGNTVVTESRCCLARGEHG